MTGRRLSSRDMPTWPRLMRAPLAAAYCGQLSEVAFRARYGKLARKDGDVTVFHKDDLDRAIDQAGTGKPAGDPYLEALKDGCD